MKSFLRSCIAALGMFAFIGAGCGTAATYQQPEEKTLTVESAVGPTYPVKLGPAGSRYLTDQNGNPFLWVGDSAWSLMAQLNLTDATTYLTDRQNKGFNVVLTNLIEHKFATNAPSNINGDAPFTGTVFTTPNPNYFNYVDSVINAAAARGIMVLLDPLYLGFNCGDEGWCVEVSAASSANMTSWGNYVGQRYASFQNIMWVIGGDTNPSAAVKAKVETFVTGLRAFDTNHLMTVHTEPESFAVTHFGSDTWLTVNDIYSYSTTMWSKANTAYARTPVMPFFLIESAYENEHSSTQQSLRAQEYWTMLSGGMGQNYGNCPMWNFNAPAASTFCSAGTWQSNLGSSGAASVQYLTKVFGPRPWHTLVPDTGHTVVTAGYGTGTTLATTERASDGATVISYLPTKRNMTLAANKVSGTTAQLWWFDPGSGTTTNGGTFATNAAKTLIPPTGGSGDWVAVVDDVSRGYPPPTPVSDNVTVNFEDQTDNTVLATYGGINWTSSPQWVVWDGSAWGYTKNAFVNTTATTATGVFTLPAGKVLKNIKIAVGSGGTASVQISSAGNTTQNYSVNGTYQNEALGWTVAASTITVQITCTTCSIDGASDLAFDDLIYGSP